VADALIVRVGAELTFKFRVLVDVHPNALVPVTVYTVATVGATVTVFPVSAPGFQVYVEAPVLVNVAVPPEHKVAGLLVAVMVGFAFTLSVTVFVVIHEPFALLTV